MKNEENQKQNKEALNRKAAVAAVFNIIAQLLVRGISFILTPIYTRLVSTAQYGDIRTYESWLLILGPILSLSMYRSVSRAKYDFRDRFEEYVSSVQGLSYIVIGLFYLIVTFFFRSAYMDFLNLDRIMYLFMILYTFSHTSVFYYQTRERHMLRYKQSVALTSLMMIPATVLSVALLYWGNRSHLYDQLVDLRVIGYYTPQIIGGMLVAFLIWKQGRYTVDTGFWKYAVLYSLPLIPETLSIQVMNQADKIMIRSMVGSEMTGIFSLGTTVSFIIWIVEDAAWNAWMPWLYEKLDREEIPDIQKPWDYIVYLFGFISWALVILAPELVFILGGSKYRESIYLVAPMVTGTLFRFFSYAFSAVENYQKKTVYCTLGSVTAMFINLALNYLAIKHIGYQAVAYTTTISYFMLMVLQGYLEKKVCGMRCVSYGKMIVLSLLFWAVNEVTIYSYRLPFYFRWIVFAVVSVAVLWKMLPQLKDIWIKLRRKK